MPLNQAIKKTARLSGFFFVELLSLLFSNGSNFLSSVLDGGDSGVSSSESLGLSLSGGLDGGDGISLGDGVDRILVDGSLTASGETKHASDSESKDNFLHFFDFLMFIIY